MKKIRIAGIDQGTTSTKVLLLKGSGKNKIKYQKCHKQITPNPGWVEHDPEEIYQNIIDSLQCVGEVDAIGLTHQGETIVAWDSETKAPLYNMIVWQDQRTEKKVQELKEAGHEPAIQEKTGLLLDSYFPASKMAWLIDNVDKVKTALDKGRLRIGTSESFFIDRLTGVYCTDYNSASRTSLFNAKTLQWDEALCSIFNVPIDILPPIKENIGHYGYHHLNGKDVPITAVMVDQFASAYGHGCRVKGDSKATFGTGAFMQVLTGEDFIIDKDTGLSSALFWKFPNEAPVYGLDAGVYNVGSAINWAQKLGLFKSYKQLNSFKKSPAIERDIVFVPALSGLACPHWDRTASGMWSGLTLRTDRKDLMQSLLEGIAFRAISNFTTMSNFVHINKSVSIDGGLVKNPYFVQFFTNMLNRHILVPKNNELTSLGIALLANKGLGLEEIKPKRSKKKVYKPKDIKDRKKLSAKFESIVEKAKQTRTVID